MNISTARACAGAWSEGGRRAAVIRAEQSELLRPYYWERMNDAIPPEQIVEIYENGQLCMVTNPARAETAQSGE